MGPNHKDGPPPLHIFSGPCDAQIENTEAKVEAPTIANGQVPKHLKGSKGNRAQLLRSSGDGLVLGLQRNWEYPGCVAGSEDITQRPLGVVSEGGHRRREKGEHHTMLAESWRTSTVS